MAVEEDEEQCLPDMVVLAFLSATLAPASAPTLMIGTVMPGLRLHQHPCPPWVTRTHILMKLSAPHAAEVQQMLHGRNSLLLLLAERRWATLIQIRSQRSQSESAGLTAAHHALTRTGPSGLPQRAPRFMSVRPSRIPLRQQRRGALWRPGAPTTSPEEGLPAASEPHRTRTHHSFPACLMLPSFLRLNP